MKKLVLMFTVAVATSFASCCNSTQSEVSVDSTTIDSVDTVCIDTVITDGVTVDSVAE